MKVGDIVQASIRVPETEAISNLDLLKYGIILDVYEDDYGTVYYEVHWGSLHEQGWWSEYELGLISEAESKLA